MNFELNNLSVKVIDKQVFFIAKRVNFVCIIDAYFLNSNFIHCLMTNISIELILALRFTFLIVSCATFYIKQGFQEGYT